MGHKYSPGARDLMSEISVYDATGILVIRFIRVLNVSEGRDYVIDTNKFLGFSIVLNETCLISNGSVRYIYLILRMHWVETTSISNFNIKKE